MRIWDIPPSKLCRQHLLGEHRELHAIWSIIVKRKKGYHNHPETQRWAGKLKALYWRHKNLAYEMGARGYHHLSPLDKHQAKGLDQQTDFVDSPAKQVSILRSKTCPCYK